MTILSRSRHALLALALLCCTGAASAGIIRVAIDTSTFGTASGYLDLQLSASSGVPLATVALTGMTGFGGAPAEAWGVTAIPGGWSFRNDVSNDLFQAVTFGGVLSFDLAFAGAIDPLGSYVSRFVVSAFDADSNPLGSFDPVTGALAEFRWLPVAGNVAVSIADPAVFLLPEPGALPVMGIGLASLLLVSRRRNAGS
jgi:hypothetical protein